jgi:hypothetical protein
VASTCTNTLGRCRPFRPVRAEGTEEFSRSFRGVVRDSPATPRSHPPMAGTLTWHRRRHGRLGEHVAHRVRVFSVLRLVARWLRCRTSDPRTFRPLHRVSFRAALTNEDIGLTNGRRRADRRPSTRWFFRESTHYVASYVDVRFQRLWMPLRNRTATVTRTLAVTTEASSLSTNHWKSYHPDVGMATEA